MKEDIRAEARQLPLMLGKLIGGILAVAGFGGLVFVWARPPEPTALSMATYAVGGILGIVVFAVSSRKMTSRFGEPARKRSMGTRTLPWVILLALGAAFIGLALVI